MLSYLFFGMDLSFIDPMHDHFSPYIILFPKLHPQNFQGTQVVHKRKDKNIGNHIYTRDISTDILIQNIDWPN